MHKEFDINRKKIKGDCQSGRKVVTHNSKSDLPLIFPKLFFTTSPMPLESVEALSSEID